MLICMESPGEAAADAQMEESIYFGTAVLGSTEA